jgi:glycosyltransferase involved in cell wall biosynthesis
MKKIAILGAHDLDFLTSDFNHLREQLMRHLKEKYVFYTYDASLRSLNHSTHKVSSRSKNECGKKHLTVPRIFRYVFSIAHALFHADAILALGSRHAWLFSILKFFSKKKIILFVHHTDLNRQASNVFSKYIFLLKETLALYNCHSIITNHESIQDQITAKYNLRPGLIEQGADHVEKIETTFTDHIRYPFLKYSYAFSFFEADSDNHIEAVLDGFKQIKNKYLVIVGDWEKTKYSLSIKNKYAGYSNIFMLNNTHDKRQLNLIRSNAILFIHSQKSDIYSTPMLEAMSIGMPVLAFESLDNKYLTEGKASYFRSNLDVKQYLNTSNMEIMRKNSFLMFNISSKRNKWSLISKKFESTIDNVLNEANTPISDFGSALKLSR